MEWFAAEELEICNIEKFVAIGMPHSGQQLVKK
jgi:hypothetical protein